MQGAALTATVDATTVHEFTAPAEDVFDAWLDPITMRAWSSRPLPGMPMTDVRRVEIDAQVGGRFTFSDMREDGEAVHWGTYRTIDRPRALVFTWFTSEEEERENASIVTLTLEPLASGCRATMTHTMAAEWAEWIPQVANAWNLMLRQIDLEFAADAGDR